MPFLPRSELFVRTILKKVLRLLVLGVLFWLPKDRKKRIDRWLRGREEYRQLQLAVDLDGLMTLELSIIPDISGGETRASLAQFRLG